MIAYTHKYSRFHPLNIIVGERIKTIKVWIHFIAFVLGISELLKKVDEEIRKSSID